MSDNQKALNYDPADPDKMKLPAGNTCGNCRHLRRCKAMFGHTETDTYCDWSPSRFVVESASILLREGADK
ncbi:hypothetical protein AB3X34_04525 [Raoultella terrigena]|uniref:hypothetical protein n=1 Tax=Raoultella terrigena TaxID=577 RepID=UPI00349FADC9